MKWSSAFIATTAFGQCISAAAIASPDTDNVALVQPSPEQQSHAERRTIAEEAERLFKRKGGGSSGGRGGGGSSGSSGSSASGAGRGSSSSSSGGSTTTGSGPRPAYGSGGAYYGGGAKQPYPAGHQTVSGIFPGLLVGSALGFWGSYWLIGAYSYPYTHSYYYHNATTNQNETKPVDCLCRQDLECGCDDNNDQTYFDSIIGNGSYSGLNHSLVTVAKVNGTDTIYINGTLPNGTTESGGTEDAYSAAGGMQNLMRAVGWVPVATTAIAIVLLS